MPSTFEFEQFQEVMTATHLARIRHPRETTFPDFPWIYRSIPEWRWAQAHFLLVHGGFSEFRNADEPTQLAFDLLLARDRRRACHAGVKPLIDAVLIYERNSRERWLLESHLLLPELPPNLAAKLGLAQTTIDYYALWFFDVRHRLSQSVWIIGQALGGVALQGFADDDLAPVWRRMAYHYGERVLDIAVAVTTGIGREKFTEPECDAVQYRIETLRLSPCLNPDRVLQIDRRLEAERRGEHPSCYYRPRRPRKATKRVSTSQGAGEVLMANLVLDQIGDRVFM